MNGRVSPKSGNIAVAVHESDALSRFNGKELGKMLETYAPSKKQWFMTLTIFQDNRGRLSVLDHFVETLDTEFSRIKLPEVAISQWKNQFNGPAVI
jgi:hypothetical protein